MCPTFESWVKNTDYSVAIYSYFPIRRITSVTSTSCFISKELSPTPVVVQKGAREVVPQF